MAYSSVTLNQNSLLTGLSNFILNLRQDEHPMGNALKFYEMFKRDVGYGDKFRIINTEAAGTYNFTTTTGNSSDLSHSILGSNIPPQEEQVMSMSRARQLLVTTESFFSDEAMGSASVYSSFIANLEAWVEDMFAIYMGGQSKSYIGSLRIGSSGSKTQQKAELLTEVKTAGSTQTATVYYTGADLEAIRRQNASIIAKTIADIKAELEDVRTDYNQLGFHRTTPNVKIIWSDKYANLIKSYLPTIYHQPEFQFENVMPAKYFGTLKITTAANKSLAAGDTFVDEDTISSKKYFPGDTVPTGGLTASAAGIKFITPDDSVICQIVDPDAIIFLSGEKVTSSFVNPQTRRTNYWLTWKTNIFGTSSAMGGSSAEPTSTAGIATCVDKGKAVVTLFADKNDPT